MSRIRLKQVVKLVMLLFIVLMLSGCTTYLSEEGSDAIIQSLKVTEKGGSSSQVTPQVKDESQQQTKSQTQLEVEAYLADQEQITYQPDGSDRYFFANSKLAASEDGYYYLTDVPSKGKYLMYYDIKTGQAEKFCSRPDCPHGKACDAFLSETEYELSSIHYYQGRIYLIKLEDDGAYLVSWAKDATDYQTHGKLWEQNGMPGNGRTIWNRVHLIYDGVFYYLYTLDWETFCIMGYPIDGKSKSVTIAEFTEKKLEKDSSFSSGILYVFEEKLYFETQISQDETICKVFQIDPASKKLNQINQFRGFSCGIYIENDDLYYYVSNEGLYRMNIQSKETTLLYKAPYTGGGRF